MKVWDNKIGQNISTVDPLEDKKNSKPQQI